MWIRTYSGKQFSFEQISPDNICIEDIAHSLSQICRFGGHSHKFYSVAQHACLVAHILFDTSRDLAKWGLLHDASEAYLGDITHPLKTFLNNHTDCFISQVESRLMEAITLKFNLPYVNYDLVNNVDKCLGLTEAKHFICDNIEDWDWCTNGFTPYEMEIDPLSAALAEEAFLRWAKLLNIK